MSYKFPKEAEILWLDSHYKKANLKQSDDFEDFFKDFCEQAFALNLNIYQDIKLFPLMNTEKNAYSSISHTLHNLTPYVQSESYIGCKLKQGSIIKSKKGQWGFADFWCYDKKHNFEMYMESKKLWLNIGKKAEHRLDADCKRFVSEALEQVKKIKNAGVDKDKCAKGAVFKVALFQIPIYYNEGQKPLKDIIDSSPNLLEDLLLKEVKKHRLEAGLLLGALRTETLEFDTDEAQERIYFL